MTSNSNGGIGRIIKAAGYSWKGLKSAYIHEAAFRQETLMVIIMTPLGIWLGENGIERALLLGSLFLVMMFELVNSAVEATVDRFGGEQHELSGRAKDIASSAVFLALLNIIVVWLLVLWP